MIPLLTIPQAAATLQVSARTLRRLVDAGALPAVRVGRLVRIDPADLAALIHTHKARPAQPADRSPVSPSKDHPGKISRMPIHLIQLTT